MYYRLGSVYTEYSSSKNWTLFSRVQFFPVKNTINKRIDEARVSDPTEISYSTRCTPKFSGTVLVPGTGSIAYLDVWIETTSTCTGDMFNTSHSSYYLYHLVLSLIY